MGPQGHAAAPSWAPRETQTTPAAVIIGVGLLLGFHLLTERTTANNEAAAATQSAQSEAANQSGNTPRSATPTSVSVPKPTPHPTSMRAERKDKR